VSRFWQWDKPLSCPKGHERMGWLGGRYWMCGPCKTVYVEVQGTEFDREPVEEAPHAE